MSGELAVTPEAGPMPVSELVQAQRLAAERYKRARAMLRQALSLGKVYMDDGAQISAYLTLLRACEAILGDEAAAGPGPWVQERTSDG